MDEGSPRDESKVIRLAGHAGRTTRQLPIRAGTFKKKAEAFEIQKVLIDLLPEKNPSHSLPEIFNISKADFDKAFPHWAEYRALNGKHLPYQGGFLDQPDQLMNNILEIDSIFEKMVQQLFSQWRSQDKQNP